MHVGSMGSQATLALVLCFNLDDRASDKEHVALSGIGARVIGDACDTTRYRAGFSTYHYLEEPPDTGTNLRIMLDISWLLIYYSAVRGPWPCSMTPSLLR